MMFKTQNYEVTKGINYEYVYVQANNDLKPTFLFLHGFPSTFYSWRHQIKYFSEQGYGCLAPNLMGYGKTYSPLNKDEYKLKSMVTHLIALLNHLHLNKVIVVGHDWGTAPAIRFVLYNPERTLSLVLISVGYRPPAKMDLDQVLETSKKILGYENFGYWKFFESDDAATIIENNVDSFIDLLFSNNSGEKKINFAPVGKIQEWLMNGQRTIRASYMTEDDYANFRENLLEGMQPKLNWYKAAIENINWDDEKNLDPIIKCPVLFFTGTKDSVCVTALFAGQKQYIADLEVVELEAGHWLMEEKPNEINQGIEHWIKRIG
ncbi:unnamed protein product [Rotaria sordida]|uniref:AB hydrolase-1 domain-containing protein n=1 Tax=Rotaria sordida TaxID=392033 RepID=A0A813VRU8_9BILA|nr:unnamed protein product [Rotaria sordida]